uniref:RING-type E3 ubiquitin transferase n=1 Tax=Aquila chrysaetos chrysaetos TaxID=223781 RepID=A0A663EY52_AQUCH
MESMATELEKHCPICLGSWEEASFVMPCLHQFCYACILRWAENKPECPLCKRRILSILVVPCQGRSSKKFNKWKCKIR